MKNTGMTRPLDHLGRIVLPKELRNSMNINIGDALDFFITSEGLMIRKYTGVSCYFCGAVDDLSYFRDHLICSDCIEKLKSDNPSSHSGETRPAQPKKRRNYRNQTELLHKLKQLMEKHPNVSQKELAEMLELSQGRVSQLKKLLL
ncbi:MULTISPECIES: AbrB/MazE/SpoVT family DNA-binding domain-containing protein [unclassified Paenibacillus]|uniref:AbrB/MazE/SpoVT family DNA-binding domain-containing protein n=1 Tax=unclassified Paenibacillus TaxID=185978 RepID=UPI0024BBE8C3|nr:AbrB/MazE/SpoVT family DNA-binding domain-containing protein [Paenibacillus sp. RC334]